MPTASQGINQGPEGYFITNVIGMVYERPSRNLSRNRILFVAGFVKGEKRQNYGTIIDQAQDAHSDCFELLFWPGLGLV